MSDMHDSPQLNSIIVSGEAIVLRIVETFKKPILSYNFCPSGGPLITVIIYSLQQYPRRL